MRALRWMARSISVAHSVSDASVASAKGAPPSSTVNPEQQVMHDRVADERRLEDLLARDADLPRDVGDEAVDRGAHGVGHLLLAARIHHHVRDAAHQVFAEANLRIHHARGGHDLAAAQVAKMRGDRRRPDVDRDAVHALAEAGHTAMIWLPPCTATVTFHAPWRMPAAAAARARRRGGPSTAIRTRAHPRAGGPRDRACREAAPRRSAGEPRDRVRCRAPLAASRHHLAVHLAVGGTSTTTSPCTCVEQDRRRPAAIGWLRQYCCSMRRTREVGGARRHAVLREFALGQHDLAPAAKAASAAHNSSMSTPSERAAAERRAERKWPRRPTRTTSASVALMAVEPICELTIYRRRA